MPSPPGQRRARLIGNLAVQLIEHPQTAPEELGPLVPHVGFHGPTIASRCPVAAIISTHPCPQYCLPHQTIWPSTHFITPQDSLQIRLKVEPCIEEFAEESGEESGEEFARTGRVSHRPSGDPSPCLPE
jgi:hypothetical protein